MQSARLFGGEVGLIDPTSTNSGHLWPAIAQQWSSSGRTYVAQVDLGWSNSENQGRWGPVPDICLAALLHTSPPALPEVCFPGIVFVPSMVGNFLACAGVLRYGKTGMPYRRRRLLRSAMDFCRGSDKSEPQSSAVSHQKVPAATISVNSCNDVQPARSPGDGGTRYTTSLGRSDDSRNIRGGAGKDEKRSTQRYLGRRLPTVTSARKCAEVLPNAGSLLVLRGWA